jgi:hypothetical protein
MLPIENEGRRSRGELTTQNIIYLKKQGGVLKENPTYIPSAKIGPEQQNWYERPHEELVKTFQNYVQKRMRRSEGEFSPAEIIAAWLRLSGHPRNRTEEDFYSPVELAWDALAYDHYTPGSSKEHRTAEALYYQYKYAHVEAIKLTDPLQVRVIDALTEAIGIPHKKAQAEIKISEKLRHYPQWKLSKEYGERLDKAITEQEARKAKSIPKHTEPKRNI